MALENSVPASHPFRHAFTHVVALVGGVGGAKLAHGLAQILPPEALTVIVNTGDDFVHYGLHISPDLDTVMYTLAGEVDRANGWGLAGDTTQMLDMLRRYGEAPWFRLGDRDLATHLLRTQALNAGERLTTITERLTTNLGIQSRILPMTDSPVRTMVDTREYGQLAFQDYFVGHRWQPTLVGLHYQGIEAASPSPEVVDAILRADAIVIAPSNPWLSVAPILDLPGMRALLRARHVPRAVISPIVAGAAIKGPAAKMMAEMGLVVSPRAVADFYRNLITEFVYDEQDAPLEFDGIASAAMQTVMNTEADRAALARDVLLWLAQRVTADSMPEQGEASS